jgi:hypothetical protein
VVVVVVVLLDESWDDIGGRTAAQRIPNPSIDNSDCDNSQILESLELMVTLKGYKDCVKQCSYRY